MLLPFLISRALVPIVACADGRAMLRIYAAQVGVMFTMGLAFKFLLLG